MSLTRDQLRAARALLHLQQDVLADIARVGVATIRRFEGGRDVGHLHLDALRRALVDAGAVLVDGGAEVTVGNGMVGVLLRPDDDLPEVTRARIAAGRTYVRGAGGVGRAGPTGEPVLEGGEHDAAGPVPVPARGRGRPKGTTRRAPRTST